MKKTYIRPELTAFQMASQYVLAGSPGITNTEYGGGTILAPEQYDIIECTPEPTLLCPIE